MKAIWIVCAVLGLSGCGMEGTGACEGEMSGRYFRLTFFNYTTTPMEVLMNGRAVGEMEPYQGLDSAGQTVPSALFAGEFPVCDGWRLDAKGVDSSSAYKFCSREPILECGGLPEVQFSCSEAFSMCEDVTPEGCLTASGIYQNYRPAAETVECAPCAGAWEPCDWDI